MIKIDVYIMNPPYVGNGHTHLSEKIYSKIKEYNPIAFIGLSPLVKESKYKTAEHINNAFAGVWNYVWMFDLLGEENEYFSKNIKKITYKEQTYGLGGNSNTPIYFDKNGKLKNALNKMPLTKETAKFVEDVNCSKKFQDGRKYTQTAQISPYFISKFYELWKNGELDYDEETAKWYENWKKKTKVSRIKTEDEI